MRQVFFTTATLALLAACAAPQGTNTPSGAAAAASPITNLQTSLMQFTLADLQNAATDAKAHNDKLATMCYDFLAARLAARASVPGTSIAGPVSAFQRLRDLRSTIVSGIAQDFQINCAPLLSDAQANLVKLGVVGAGAMASGGVLP